MFGIFRGRWRLLWLIYVIIGIVVAWDRGYITVRLLQLLLSALLAIWLWWLVLLGVSLHLS
ncbi:MAG TPA: hypothetical protein VHU92_23040 [Streptosporangiaceae bacterium]|jgi:hypothetical protein|nr:hypothetical protein [Streptosporangiaceae bacterium]